MKTSYLGLMVKRLNRVENTIDNFDDLTSTVANYLFGQYEEEPQFYKPNISKWYLFV